MTTVPSLRIVSLLLAAVFAPLFLTQCKTSAKTYKDVSYDPAKLKTPAGHGLDRKSYPFDEGGTYRKDWVKNNTSGRDPSATSRPEPTSTTVPSGAVAATDTAPSSTPATYPTYAQASSARASGNFVGPVDGAAAGSISIPTTATTLAAAGPATGSAPIELASAAPVPSAPAAPSYHRVASGDTLYAIANRHGTSVADLKRVNGLSGDNIRVGQSLRLP